MRIYQLDSTKGDTEMSYRECHLPGCGTVVKITGDGSRPSKMISGERVVFCSLSHFTEYERDQRLLVVEENNDPAQLTLQL